MTDTAISPPQAPPPKSNFFRAFEAFVEIEVASLIAGGHASDTTKAREAAMFNSIMLLIQPSLGA